MQKANFFFKSTFLQLCICYLETEPNLDPDPYLNPESDPDPNLQIVPDPDAQHCPQRKGPDPLVTYLDHMIHFELFNLNYAYFHTLPVVKYLSNLP